MDIWILWPDEGAPLSANTDINSLKAHALELLRLENSGGEITLESWDEIKPNHYIGKFYDEIGLPLTYHIKLVAIDMNVELLLKRALPFLVQTDDIGHAEEGSFQSAELRSLILEIEEALGIPKEQRFESRI